MKTRLLTMIIVACSALTAQAQNMKEIFSTLPDSIIPTLTKNDRLDCVDLIESNMTNEITNRLHGKSRLTMLTEDIAKLKLSSMAEVQMKKLPADNGYVILMIRSVKIDNWDSTIKVYDRNWQLLNRSQYIKMPTLDSFLTQPADMDAETFSNKKRMIDFAFIHADLKDDTVVFTLTTSNDKDETFRTEVGPMIRNQITVSLK